jgi:hypothetical protein
VKRRADGRNAAAERRVGYRRNEAKSGETKTKRGETDNCVSASRKALIVNGGEIGDCAATSVFNALYALHCARQFRCAPGPSARKAGPDQGLVYSTFLFSEDNAGDAQPTIASECDDRLTLSFSNRLATLAGRKPLRPSEDRKQHGSSGAE